MHNLKPKTQEEINNSLSQNFEEILGSLSEGLILADINGILYFANPRFCQIVGQDEKSILGRKVYDILYPNENDDSQELKLQMQRRYKDRLDGLSETYEINFTRQDGLSRWLEISAAPLRNLKGEIIGSIGINIDITQRKELEEQLRLSQKMEVVGRLAGGLAHDFNNLLTVISGYASILSRVFKIGEKNHRHVEAIKEASQMATALTQQLLTVSRRQILQLESLDLNKVVLDSLSIIQNLVGPNISVNLKLDNKLAPILADPSQLQQILINLALNSRDAMHGEGRLSIKTSILSSQNEAVKLLPGSISAPTYAVLSISDNGSGISEKVRKHLFEPFFTTKKKGTGLGLSTVYGIVKQHNSEITVKSEPGVFTTFEIFFPTTEVPISQSKKEKLSTTPQISYRGNESILLVEDGIEVKKLVTELLEELGYKVTATDSSSYAAELLKTIWGNSIF